MVAVVGEPTVRLKCQQYHINNANMEKVRHKTPLFLEMN